MSSVVTSPVISPIWCKAVRMLEAMRWEGRLFWKSDSVVEMASRTFLRESRWRELVTKILFVRSLGFMMDSILSKLSPMFCFFEAEI